MVRTSGDVVAKKHKLKMNYIYILGYAFIIAPIEIAL